MENKKLSFQEYLTIYCENNDVSLCKDYVIILKNKTINLKLINLLCYDGFKIMYDYINKLYFHWIDYLEDKELFFLVKNVNENILYSCFKCEIPLIKLFNSKETIIISRNFKDGNFKVEENLTFEDFKSSLPEEDAYLF